MLATYRSTHLFQYPGCICPLLNPGTSDNNETVLFIAPHGEYEGHLVVGCARGACGYLGVYQMWRLQG